jgi:nitrite reductase/ring-hydroxylating ferredoxin subunit
MKKLLSALTAIIVLSGCSNSETHYKNPYIPNYSFSIIINMNLPLYSGLKSPINPIPIDDANGGVKGIIAMQVSSTDYRVWERTCPNQYPSSCSRMEIDGVTAKCPCDDVIYSLFDGQPQQGFNVEYPMKPYRVEIINPTTIRIYN